jgi:hypothetical protein
MNALKPSKVEGNIHLIVDGQKIMIDRYLTLIIVYNCWCNKSRQYKMIIATILMIEKTID